MCWRSAIDRPQYSNDVDVLCDFILAFKGDPSSFEDGAIFSALRKMLTNSEVPGSWYSHRFTKACEDGVAQTRLRWHLGGPELRELFLVLVRKDF